MPTEMVDAARLKEIVKEALIELIEEGQGPMYDLLAEVLEDMALRRAIEEGESTESVDRAAVFQVLESES